MWGVWQKFHTQYWIERTYYSCSWKKRFNCDQCVHEKDFELNCDHCVQKFHQSLQFGNTYTNSSWVTQNTGLKLQITTVYENKKFTWDQCDKTFARGCNLKVLIQNVHEIYSWIVNTVTNILPKHSICGKSFTKSKLWSTKA